MQLINRRRLDLVKGVLCAVACLAGCLPPTSDPPPLDVAQVDIRNSAFVPSEITIRVGETVRWTNTDPVFHTITSGNPGDADAGVLFDSFDLLPFDSFSHRFDTPGEFVYFSKLDIARPGMVGARVIVTP